MPMLRSASEMLSWASVQLLQERGIEHERAYLERLERGGEAGRAARADRQGGAEAGGIPGKNGGPMPCVRLRRRRPAPIPPSWQGLPRLLSPEPCAQDRPVASPRGSHAAEADRPE